MITQAPDKNLDAYRLENEINACLGIIRKRDHWYLREKIVDRGCIYDPFYIIDFREEVDSQGDTTWNEPLYYINSYCSVKQLTSEPARAGHPYWQKIGKRDLERRLKRFHDLYRENFFQPPGYKEDAAGRKTAHEKFHKKRFIYELRSPLKSIVGIGPAIYAGGFASGALCGQVTDHNGAPLKGVVVEVISGEWSLDRTTIAGGLFWFSKVPEGRCSIRVKGRSCQVHILKNEAFGNIKSWLTDNNGYPIEYGVVKFRAPDGEVFSATSDDTGQFTTGPLPAFPVADTPLSSYPYIMQVPDFMFSVKKTVHVSDAVIGGKLRDNNGTVLTNETVLLKQKGVQLAETRTDGHGYFRFFGLKGGKYELEVPGQKIYISRSTPGRIVGKEKTGIVNETRMELVADDKVVSTERLNMNQEYSFDHVAPGGYEVRVK